jgi:hypothetical protein
MAAPDSASQVFIGKVNPGAMDSLAAPTIGIALMI